MKHFLRLTLEPRNVKAIVTCEDHADCPANLLIQEDETEFGRYSEYPNFLDWYDGPKTPAHSGYINLELSENFVKWSYVAGNSPLTPEVIESCDHDLFYEPVLRRGKGLFHTLKSTSRAPLTEEERWAYEQSLDGLISSYTGTITEYRAGFIKLIETKGYFAEDEDLLWTYAENKTDKVENS